MIKNYISAVLLFSALMFSNSYSEEKSRIAILDLKAKGVSKITAGAITDLIRSEIVTSGLFKVVERSQIDIILKEQGFQQSGCTDQDCAIKIGKIVSASRMLIGEVSKVDNAILITCRIVDVREGVSEYAASEKVIDAGKIDAAAQSVVQKLISKIEDENNAAQNSGKYEYVEAKPDSYSIYNEPDSNYYILGLIPGLGQYYIGNYIKGNLFLGAFMASGMFWIYATWDYNVKRQEYENLGSYSSAGEFDSKHDAADGAASRAKVSAGIFIAVYVINLIDILFISGNPDYSIFIDAGSDDLIIADSNLKMSYIKDDMNSGYNFGVEYDIRF